MKANLVDALEFLFGGLVIATAATFLILLATWVVFETRDQLAARRRRQANRRRTIVVVDQGGGRRHV